MKMTGSITALITPFRNGALDEEAYEAFCDWQISEGTNGLVPCGTTGESPVLSEEEHTRVVALAVKAAKKRVPVIAGAGSNSTAHAVHLAKIAEKAGADAVLVVCPYYNKPTQEGLYQHFKTVAAATNLPLIIYNIPGRSAVDMSVETMKRLSEIKNIVGVKDATANLARVVEQRIACGKEFIQLSGEDGTAVAFNAQGGVGCISVLSNVAPRLCADMQRASLAGDYPKALDILVRLTPLIKALFAETSPAPAKYALSLLGKCAEDIRLPLVPPGNIVKEQVRTAMVAAGLLN
jgi:4-hydroxy-tetrahydrodipicolinate synthase